MLVYRPGFVQARTETKHSFLTDWRAKHCAVALTQHLKSCRGGKLKPQVSVHHSNATNIRTTIMVGLGQSHTNQLTWGWDQLLPLHVCVPCWKQPAWPRWAFMSENQATKRCFAPSQTWNNNQICLLHCCPLLMHAWYVADDVTDLCAASECTKYPYNLLRLVRTEIYLCKILPEMAEELTRFLANMRSGSVHTWDAAAYRSQLHHPQFQNGRLHVKFSDLSCKTYDVLEMYYGVGECLNTTLFATRVKQHDELQVKQLDCHVWWFDHWRELGKEMKGWAFLSVKTCPVNIFWYWETSRQMGF